MMASRMKFAGIARRPPARDANGLSIAALKLKRLCNMVAYGAITSKK
jgi:hypothetical protein